MMAAHNGNNEEEGDMSDRVAAEEERAWETLMAR